MPRTQSRTHTLKSADVEPVFKPVSDPERASPEDMMSVQGAAGRNGEDPP